MQVFFVVTKFIRLLSFCEAIKKELAKSFLCSYYFRDPDISLRNYFWSSDPMCMCADLDQPSRVGESGAVEVKIIRHVCFHQSVK